MDFKTVAIGATILIIGYILLKPSKLSDEELWLKNRPDIGYGYHDPVVLPLVTPEGQFVGLQTDISAAEYVRRQYEQDVIAQKTMQADITARAAYINEGKTEEDRVLRARLWNAMYYGN